MDVINLKKDQWVNIKGYQSSYTGTAFILKLNNINLTSVISANITYDNTASVGYTANSDSEYVLLVSMANALNRQLGTSNKGIIFKSGIEEEGFYIRYLELNKSSYAAVSAYGYNMGGGATFILH